ncbi:hypothetical protein [Blastopirellula marina]|nr:hypothetical protein [Blastopirellula marina]
MSDDEIVPAEIVDERDPFAPVDRRTESAGTTREKFLEAYKLSLQLYEKFPHACLSVVLVATVAFGTLFGLLDLPTAGMALVVGGLFLVSSYHIGKLANIGPLGLLFLIAFLAFHKAGSQPQRGPVMNGSSARINDVEQFHRLRGVNNENFWQNTIASRHLLRFGPSDQGTFVDVAGLVRFYEQLKADVTRTRAFAESSKKSVSLDLYTLAIRLLDTDQRELDLIKQAIDKMGTKNRRLSQKPLAEAIQEIEQMSDKQWAQLPPEAHQWLADLGELMEARQKLYQEIIETQSMLRERYPNHPFPLPDIGLDTHVMAP